MLPSPPIIQVYIYTYIDGDGFKNTIMLPSPPVIQVYIYTYIDGDGFKNTIMLTSPPVIQVNTGLPTKNEPVKTTQNYIKNDNLKLDLFLLHSIEYSNGLLND